MTIELSALQRLAVYREPDGSFATDHSATPGDFQDIPFQSGSLSFNFNPQKLDKGTVQQHIDGHDGATIGRYRPTLSFTMIAHPATTKAVDGVTSITSANCALFCLLEGILGGEVSGNEGTTLGTITNAYTVAADTGDGAEWAKHYGIGLQDSAGNFEIHEIQGVSTDTLTTKATPTFTPTTALAALNTTSFYLDESDKSFQFIYEGAEQSDRWLFQGMQVTSVTFNIPTDEFPTITFNFEGVHVQQLASAAISQASYENFSPVFKTGKFLLATSEDSAGSTTTELCVPSRSLALNLQFGPVICPGETYGISRYKRRRSAPVATLEATTYYELETYFDAVPLETDYYVSQQVGTTASEGGFAFVMPSAQLVGMERVDSDGLAAQTLMFEAQQDTNESTTLGLSPFRIHFA